MLRFLEKKVVILYVDNVKICLHYECNFLGFSVQSCFLGIHRSKLRACICVTSDIDRLLLYVRSPPRPDFWLPNEAV